MLTEIIHKLWNRGIDIGVGVITALIVAVIGLVFWRAKLWFDLRADERKQRQQHKISSELEAKRTDVDTRAWRAKLPFDREDFAIAAESAASYPELVRCWVNYVLWLRRNNLSELPRNLKILNQHGDNGWHISSIATSEGLPDLARSTAETIRKTELPPDSSPVSVRVTSTASSFRSSNGESDKFNGVPASYLGRDLPNVEEKLARFSPDEAKLAPQTAMSIPKEKQKFDCRFPQLRSPRPN